MREYCHRVWRDWQRFVRDYAPLNLGNDGGFRRKGRYILSVLSRNVGRNRDEPPHADRYDQW